MIILNGCYSNKKPIWARSNFHQPKYFEIYYKHKNLKREGALSYFTAKDDSITVFAALKENEYFYKETDVELLFLCDGYFYGLKKISAAGEAHRYCLYAKEIIIDDNGDSYIIPFPSPQKKIHGMELNTEIPFADNWRILKDFYEAMASEHITIDDENKMITIDYNNEVSFIISCFSSAVTIEMADR